VKIDSQTIFVLGAGFTKAFCPMPASRGSLFWPEHARAVHSVSKALAILDLELGIGAQTPARHINLERLMTVSWEVCLMFTDRRFRGSIALARDHSGVLASPLQKRGRHDERPRHCRLFVGHCLTNRIHCITFNMRTCSTNTSLGRARLEPKLGYGFPPECPRL